jgi:hypothetical protein
MTSLVPKAALLEGLMFKMFFTACLSTVRRHQVDGVDAMA